MILIKQIDVKVYNNDVKVVYSFYTFLDPNSLEKKYTLSINGDVAREIEKEEGNLIYNKLRKKNYYEITPVKRCDKSDLVYTYNQDHYSFFLMEEGCQRFLCTCDVNEKVETYNELIKKIFG